MNSYYTIKTGTTQVWDESGRRYVATVLKADPLTVTQIKSVSQDGYAAVQVALGQKHQPLKKSLKHHLASAKLDHKPRYLRELKLESTDEDLKLGQSISIDQMFAVGNLLKATGVSKGRGFSGVMKRWGFGGGPKTHGQSDRSRAPGSIGQGTDPGRVHKGKKMAGRYGNQTVTVENLTLLAINPQDHTVLVSGPVPGPIGSLIKLTKISQGKPVKLLNQTTDSESPNLPQESSASSTPTPQTTESTETTETEPPKDDSEKDKE